MQMSKILPVLGLALLVAGCTTITPEEQRARDESTCRSYGFIKRNDAFANCLLQIDLDRHQARRDFQYQRPYYYYDRPFYYYGPGVYYRPRPRPAPAKA